MSGTAAAAAVLVLFIHVRVPDDTGSKYLRISVG